MEMKEDQKTLLVLVFRTIFFLNSEIGRKIRRKVWWKKLKLTDEIGDKQRGEKRVS